MTPAHSELFLHIRVLIGVLLGLSVTKLLSGLASFAEHPKRYVISVTHLAWVCWAMLAVLGYWWWEYQLLNVSHWSLGRYIFLFFYASSYFFICSLLFPRDIVDYEGYQQYFIERRAWFFGSIILTYVLDIGDTALKGYGYFSSLGPSYMVRTVLAMIVCAVAIYVSNRRFHLVLAIIAVLYQIGVLAIVYDAAP